MKDFLQRLDELAGTNNEDSGVQWLERVAFAFLILMVVSAPHSIAATQTAWITGMFVWIVRLFFKPRVKLRFGALDAALWGLFAWSVISSVVSYDPATSIDKLRGTALFLIVYFVIYNLRNLRAVYFAAFMLIFSCMVNVIWTPVQRMIGRGVEIHGLRPESPLAKALLWEGDTLLAADGKKLSTPDDVAEHIEEREVTKIKFYRPDFDFSVDVKRGDILPGTTAFEKLGIESWKKSRNWRSSGFYGHYTTYAEVLQLIASLVFGLLIAAFASVARHRTKIIVLAACLAGMLLALLLTVTRASQLAFMISAAVIVVVGLGRKWVFRAALLGLPVMIIGLMFLQQSREVGFFDTKDDSIRWRQTVWREGFELWTKEPRHFVFGVGLDSIKKYAKEWHLFDDGRLNMGHFHSTPLQLLVERGLPALIIWLIVLGIYSRTLWRGLRSDGAIDWRSRGILLGCLGGMIGFFASSLVHYNLGDQEVAMVFFILMGFVLQVVHLQENPSHTEFAQTG
ncbi:MAG: O-antigen ligase family protein [Pyrinomonadaceae bacterium]